MGTTKDKSLRQAKTPDLKVIKLEYSLRQQVANHCDLFLGLRMNLKARYSGH